MSSFRQSVSSTCLVLPSTWMTIIDREEHKVFLNVKVYKKYRIGEYLTHMKMNISLSRKIWIFRDDIWDIFISGNAKLISSQNVCVPAQITCSPGIIWILWMDSHLSLPGERYGSLDSHMIWTQLYAAHIFTSRAKDIFLHLSPNATYMKTMNKKVNTWRTKHCSQAEVSFLLEF